MRMRTDVGAGGIVAQGHEQAQAQAARGGGHEQSGEPARRPAQQPQHRHGPEQVELSSVDSDQVWLSGPRPRPA